MAKTKKTDAGGGGSKAWLVLVGLGLLCIVFVVVVVVGITKGWFKSSDTTGGGTTGGGTTGGGTTGGGTNGDVSKADLAALERKIDLVEDKVETPPVAGIVIMKSETFTKTSTDPTENWTLEPDPDKSMLPAELPLSGKGVVLPEGKRFFLSSTIYGSTNASFVFYAHGRIVNGNSVVLANSGANAFTSNSYKDFFARGQVQTIYDTTGKTIEERTISMQIGLHYSSDVDAQIYASQCFMSIMEI